VEHGGGQQRERGQHAVAQGDRGFYRHQRAHPRPVHDVAHRLADRGQRVRRSPAVALGLHRAADRPHQRRRRHQAHRGHQEADVRADSRRQQPTERGADDEHRAPRGAGDRVGRRQVLQLDHVRQGRPSGRRVERLRHRICPDSRHRQPRRTRRPHQEQDQHRRHTGQVGGQHDPAPVEPVGDRPGERQQDRQDAGVGGQHQAAPQPAAGQLGQQRHQRDQDEPVATEDDQLGTEQAAEVPVSGKDRQGS